MSSLCFQTLYGCFLPSVVDSSCYFLDKMTWLLAKKGVPWGVGVVRKHPNTHWCFPLSNALCSVSRFITTWCHLMTEAGGIMPLISHIQKSHISVLWRLAPAATTGKAHLVKMVRNVSGKETEEQPGLRVWATLGDPPGQHHRAFPYHRDARETSHEVGVGRESCLIL